MSFTLLGILNSQAAGVAQSYFLSVLGGSGSEEPGSVAIDSADNVYVVGETNSEGAGLDNFLIAKYDSSFTVNWQRVLGGSGADRGSSVAIDSVDNVYVVGQTNSEGAGNDDLLLAKYDSSGTINWQRVLGGSGAERGFSVAIDSAENVYVAGTTTSTGAGTFDFLLAKYDSSGTVLWQRVLGTGNQDFVESIAFDSADNVYILGRADLAGAGGFGLLFAKYNSSGTIQWQRTLSGSGTDNGYSIALDSADNVYLVGDTDSEGAGNDDLLLAKYDSSGTIQWQRTLGGSANDEGKSVAIDSADNIYVVGGTASDGAGEFDFLLAKYDSSGTIQWQRALGGAGTDKGFSVALDSAQNFYVFGYTLSTGAGSFDFLLSKLPNDGSLEGTYSLDGNNIIYQPSSLTAQTSLLTAETSSLASSSASLTSATSTLTNASGTLTVVTEEIG